ncbi:SidA/IucD/PvdA family monooxygenase [Bacillus velezensis]|nr:SidA/IucD/PvdA family monooxygenase [Bacillus velezensis]
MKIPPRPAQWVTRSAGFRELETAKLGQEMFTPDYVEYFNRLPFKERLNTLLSWTDCATALILTHLPPFTMPCITDRSAEVRLTCIFSRWRSLKKLKSKTARTELSSMADG